MTGTERRRERIDLLGCPIDPYTSSELLAELRAAIDERAGARLIHFVNGNKIAKAHADAGMRELLWRGDYVLADGQPLLPMARMLGLRIPERIDGIGLMYTLLSVAHEQHYRVYLFGAQEDVLKECVAVIRRRYPNAVVAGARNGYFKSEELPEIVAAINAARADILFVGINSPLKEQFADSWKSRLSPTVIQGVGGSFDVLAGRVTRAPGWMQRIGLEWLYRVLQEPRRMLWRYVVTNTQCLYLFAYALLFRANRSGHGGAAPVDGR